MHGKDKTQVLHSSMFDLCKNCVETWYPRSCKKTLAVLEISLRENMHNSKIWPLFIQKQSDAPVNGSYLYEIHKNLKSDITVN